MTKVFAGILVSACALLLALNLTASGPAGVYALVEKIVLEPSEQNAQRIQIWGAFSFIDGGILCSTAASVPERGYLYFSFPDFVNEAKSKIIKAEWSDLKAIAGTGQAVAFGDWAYYVRFSSNGGSELYVIAPTDIERFRVDRSYLGTPLRVLSASSTNSVPVPYVSNTGIVKLPAEGSHAEIVKRLKQILDY